MLILARLRADMSNSRLYDRQRGTTFQTAVRIPIVALVTSEEVSIYIEFHSTSVAVKVVARLRRHAITLPWQSSCVSPKVVASLAKYLRPAK